MIFGKRFIVIKVLLVLLVIVLIVRVIFWIRTYIPADAASEGRTLISMIAKAEKDYRAREGSYFVVPATTTVKELGIDASMNKYFTSFSVQRSFIFNPAEKNVGQAGKDSCMIEAEGKVNGKNIRAFQMLGPNADPHIRIFR